MFKTKRTNKKEGRAFRVHPLFFLAGIYACFTKSLPLYLGAVTVALQHECAHSFAAARLGFRLNQVVLTPFGATISGDLSGISLKDEISVAMAGPLCNLVTALFFAALWWLFPDTYAYTDTAFYLSLYIGAGNLLPFYPLDGGRVLRAAIAMKTGEKTAEKICRSLTLVAGAAVFCLAAALFVKKTLAAPLFVFSVFLIVGALSGGGRYEKITPDFTAAFLRGVAEKRVAIDASCSLKRALSFCESGKYLRLDVFKNGEKIFETDEKALTDFLSGETLYLPLSAMIGKTESRADNTAMPHEESGKFLRNCINSHKNKNNTHTC